MTLPDDVFLFSVDVIEGRGFGFELQALNCVLTFGGESRETPYSVAKDAHTWSCTLTWRVSRQQLRRLSAAGQSQCKLTVRRRDAEKVLGWLVLDTRKAKLNPQYSDPEGEWMTLSGGVVSSRDAPQVHVRYKLLEEAVKAQDEGEAMMQKLSTTLASKKPAAVARQSSGGGNRDEGGEEAGGGGRGDVGGASDAKPGPRSGSGSGYSSGFEAAEDDAPRASSGPDGAEGPEKERAAAAGPRPAAEDESGPPALGSRSGSGSGGGGGGGGGDEAMRLPDPGSKAGLDIAAAASAAPPPPRSADAALLSSAAAGPSAADDDSPPPYGPALSRPAARGQPSIADGPFRHFVLSLELRSFQAGVKLPLNTSSTYVQALLPASIIELLAASGGRPPTRMVPLKTHPPVDITRGTEGALLNGHGSVEFVAGVMELARVLGADPYIAIEVWHKERFRSDLLLGLASVSLEPLLHDCWMDGYAPVMVRVGEWYGAGAGD